MRRHPTPPPPLLLFWGTENLGKGPCHACSPRGRGKAGRRPSGVTSGCGPRHVECSPPRRPPGTRQQRRLAAWQTGCAARAGICGGQWGSARRGCYGWCAGQPDGRGPQDQKQRQGGGSRADQSAVQHFQGQRLHDGGGVSPPTTLRFAVECAKRPGLSTQICLLMNRAD